jgi:DNA-binding IclR family transcriptional regulator
MGKYNVPSLERALDVLEYLSASRAACPLSVLSKDVNKSPSELFRIMDCLVRRGYVRKDSTTNNYSLSLKLYSVANNVPFVKRLIDAAMEPMSILTKQVGESCHISVLEGSDLVVLYEQEGEFPVHIHARTGARIPISMTSSGRVLVGLLPEHKQKVILENDENYQAETDDFKEIFLNELCSIGDERSHVILPERFADFGMDIIAPVKLFGDYYAALALSCFGLKNNRKHRKDIKDIRALVENAALSIEEFLGNSHALPHL